MSFSYFRTRTTLTYTLCKKSLQIFVANKLGLFYMVHALTASLITYLCILKLYFIYNLEISNFTSKLPQGFSKGFPIEYCTMHIELRDRNHNTCYINIEYMCSVLTLVTAESLEISRSC